MCLCRGCVRHSAAPLSLKLEMMLENKYIAAIYAGLRAKGLQDQKEELVSSYTNERTTSTRGMTKREALDLIAYLNGDQNNKEDKRSKMIRYIYSLAYQMNMTQITKKKTKVDTERLNALAKRLSPQKKGLQEHTYDELKTLVSLFNKYYKEQLNKGGFYESPNT